jgi:hypothetical protein
MCTANILELVSGSLLALEAIGRSWSASYCFLRNAAAPLPLFSSSSNFQFLQFLSSVTGNQPTSRFEEVETTSVLYYSTSSGFCGMIAEIMIDLRTSSHNTLDGAACRVSSGPLRFSGFGGMPLAITCSKLFKLDWTQSVVAAFLFPDFTQSN